MAFPSRWPPAPSNMTTLFNTVGPTHDQNICRHCHKKGNKNRQEKKLCKKSLPAIKSLRRVPTTEAVYHGKSDQFSIHNGKLWNKFVKFQNFWKPTESMLCSLLCRSEIKSVYCYQLSGHCCPKKSRSGSFQRVLMLSKCVTHPITQMCNYRCTSVTF